MMMRSIALRGATISSKVRPGSCSAARALHVSKTNRDAAHGSSAHAAEEEHEHYPSEGFGAPIWRYTFLTGIAFAAWYRYSSTQEAKHGDEDDEANKPFLTRYIEYNMPKKAVWEARNARHLELIRQNAETRILFSTAERPPIRRTSYDVNGTGSPNRLLVGDYVDMSPSAAKEEEE